MKAVVKKVEKPYVPSELVIKEMMIQKPGITRDQAIRRLQNPSPEKKK